MSGAWACEGVRREEGGPWSGDGALFMLLSQIPPLDNNCVMLAI